MTGMRMPFERLMELVAALPGADQQLPMGALAERWGEPVERIADAMDALRVAAGERTYITLKRRPPEEARERMLAAGLPPEFVEETTRESEP